MDYDSSSKFISSLAKFLQSLCNGYVEFDTGVQVIGHLYLSVDTGKTIDYILNEKVCKTDENSVTFISNSFHAQPAERPKPPGKRQGKDSDKTELKNEEESDNGISAQVEPRSTNVGTLPSVRNTKQNSPHSHGGKRPYSPSLKQSQSKSGRTSPKHKKSRSESLDLNTSQLSNPAGENSMSSAPSPTADSGPSNSVSARGSDASHGPQVNESYQQSFYQPDEEGSLADETEERDVKPSIDTDVTFIKEEFAPSSGCSQTGGQSHDRTHGDDPYSYQTNQIYPGSYPGQGGFGASSQRSNFSSSGPSHMFSPGQSSSQVEENSGDPTDIKHDITSGESAVHEKQIHDAEFESECKYEGTPYVVQAFTLAEPGEHGSSHRLRQAMFLKTSNDGFPERDMEDMYMEPGAASGKSNGSTPVKIKRRQLIDDQSDSTESVLKTRNAPKPSKAKGVFECDLCGKEYSYMRGLQRHKWVCADVKRVHCEYCDMSFNLRQQYKKHLKVVHGSLDLSS